MPRKYSLTLHVTTSEGRTFQSRKFMAKGRTAEEAREWAIGAGLRLWPSATIVVGPAKWLKGQDIEDSKDAQQN